MRPKHPILSRFAWALVLGLGLFVGVSPALADPRTDYLIRLLQTSTEFRTRTQAALSLGRLAPAPEVTQALVRAMSDENPAVRAAAASSLETVGDASALLVLRTAQTDRDTAVRTAAQRASRAIEARGRNAAVAVTTTTTTTTAATTTTTTGSTTTTPNPNARYYVGVGLPGTRGTSLDAAALREVRAVLVREVATLEGVEVAPENETANQTNGVLRRRSLAGFFLDSSITTLESSPTGTRAVISVIVGTYPGRDMRAMLQGSATVPGATGPEAQQMALEGAIRGALRRLPQAMAASAPSASR